MNIIEPRFPLILRLDDVGASSKRYEIYSSLRVRLGPLGVPTDWLFLKYLPGLRAWGPYSELSAERWCQIFTILEQNNACITLGVTAAWVEDEQRLVPYPTKFPEAAAEIKNAYKRGIVEIANHGLTHCTAVGNAFKPRWFAGNREFHREFNSKISIDVQHQHLYESQRILNDYFETDVVTFIPPGRQFSRATLSIAKKVGLKYIAYNVRDEGLVLPIEEVISFLSRESDVSTIGMEDLVTLQLLEAMLGQSARSRHHRMISFHDREIVLNGITWLENVLNQNKSSDFAFASDMGHSFPVDGLVLRA